MKNKECENMPFLDVDEYERYKGSVEDKDIDIKPKRCLLSGGLVIKCDNIGGTPNERVCKKCYDSFYSGGGTLLNKPIPIGLRKKYLSSVEIL
jgi:hypothetical protein